MIGVMEPVAARITVESTLERGFEFPHFEKSPQPRWHKAHAAVEIVKLYLRPYHIFVYKSRVAAAIGLVPSPTGPSSLQAR